MQGKLEWQIIHANPANLQTAYINRVKFVRGIGVLYASLVPLKFATMQAIEVGPISNKSGPCLVKLVGVTISPSEALSWLQKSILLRYVVRFYWIEHNQLPVPDKVYFLSYFHCFSMSHNISIHPKSLLDNPVILPMKFRLRGLSAPFLLLRSIWYHYAHLLFWKTVWLWITVWLNYFNHGIQNCWVLISKGQCSKLA